ncbi:unnamed protein product [Rhizophagus irregularis]|uniref:Uncharacterized protein n=1 Tax=Rhizophagus irregularis TaxID=588596 RepID=A0A915Z9D4_9GLOM|nr:unnamed protein product [Rhizophagus irregularis]CAB5367007.1 unnamed protein product [Rhizophagus irregularis]
MKLKFTKDRDDHFVRYYEIYMGSDTSDDTKELEKRSNNTHSLQSSKKTRTIPSPAEKDDESPYIPLEIDWFPTLFYNQLITYIWLLKIIR